MRTAISLICVLSSAAWCADDAGGKLLEAVRKGDNAAVKAMLGSGASANSKDDTGSTALMYAGAYGSIESMRLLLDRGADVNAANGVHATALMWSVAEPEKVRLLLEKGANVNGRTDDQQSALLLAVRQSNCIESVRLLLTHGADAKAVDKQGVGLLVAAYSNKDPALLEASHAAGLKLTKADQLGPYPLLTVLDSQDPARIEEVLKLGADINEKFAQVTDKVPVLGVMAYAGAVPVVSMLVGHGADPNVEGDRGFTPLMMAAGADRPEPAMIRLLLQKGAAVNAQDGNGRTALDWALPQGETETVRLLREAGGKSMAKASTPPPAVAAPRSVREAVEAAIPRLQPVSKRFFDNYGCISCHNHSLPSVAVTHARTQGVMVDATMATHPDKETLEEWTPLRESAIQGTCLDQGGFVAIVSYGLFAMAENGVAPNRVTDAMALCLARTQNDDGSWNQKDARPPLSGGPIVYTALVLHDLGIYLPAGRRNEWKTRFERGRAFLRKAQPMNTQEAAFLLMGLHWAGEPTQDVQRLRDRLLALQRPDGGWADKPTMSPDPYATGQALHALHVAGVPVSQEEYRKGVQYLLRTQREDGTWFMPTRAFGFQPYFDSGFPYGADQFISTAASSWATLALDHVLEAPKRASSGGGPR